MTQRSSTADPAEASTPEQNCGCDAVAHSLSDSELASDVGVLSTLASDTRYEVLRLVAGASDDVCVCELEPALDVSQSAVSQALSRLYGDGLVSRRKEGRWRYYSTTPRAEALLDTIDEIRRDSDE